MMNCLNEIIGSKDNGLVVRNQLINDTYFFFIEDLNGKVVRRLKTSEAWIIAKSQEPGQSQKTGQLLNKSM